jgi:hypothetical protein
VVDISENSEMSLILVCCVYIVCFFFSLRSYLTTHSAPIVNQTRGGTETCVLHVTCLMFLSVFNRNLNLWTDFGDNNKYEISRKSVFLESLKISVLCGMPLGGRFPTLEGS